MPKKLSPHQLNMLRDLEPKLRAVVKANKLHEAEALIKRIQALFVNDRDHHRVLVAKNWYYECLVENGRTEEAKAGLEVVRLRANENTRVFLEASSLLAVCCLRLQRIEEAKQLLRLVTQNINAITSNTRRQQFQKRLIQRIEDEVLLSQLIGRNEGELKPAELQAEAIKLLNEKSPEEIYALIGGLMPQSTSYLLQDVRSYAVHLLPAPDQKLLPSSKNLLPKEAIGKKAMAATKRIAWRTFCDPESEVYKLWSQKVPKVFGEGFFTSAFVTTLAQWKIGIPQLAAGVVAIAMRFGCAEFCSLFKPDGLMIPRDE